MATLRGDPGFDRTIPVDAYVYFTPYWEVRRRLTEGDIVIYRHTTDGLPPYRIRRVVKRSTGFELVPESKSRRRFKSFTYRLGNSVTASTRRASSVRSLATAGPSTERAACAP